MAANGQGVSVARSIPPEGPGLTPAPDEAPSFVGRADILAAVEEALTAPGSVGAVLVGEAGVGKTAVVQQVLSSSATALYVLRIRGARGFRDQAYRPVNFLLTELEADVVEHPVMVLRAVADFLNQQARGRRVVLAVDNVEYLDASSAALIGQLVLGGTASVLLTAQDFAAADPQFAGLWRDGSLRRLDLAPFDALEARAFAAAELHGAVSAEAAALLYRMSGGNARFLQASIRAVRGRSVVRHGETWVLLPGSIPVPTEIAEAVQLILEELPPGQQEIAHVVALAGCLPLSVTQSITGSADLDALQTAGLVAVRHGEQECVEFRDPVIGAGTAASLSALHAGELYDKWVEGAVLGDLLDPERHTQWLLKCQRPVPAGLSLAAARSAKRAGRYSTAVEYAELGDAHRSSAAAAVERLRALTFTGRFQDAGNALLLAAPLLDDAPAAEAVPLLLAGVFLRHRLGLGGVDEALDEAAERLESDATVDPGERARLRADIVIARAEVASLEGRFVEARDLVLSLRSDGAPLGRDQGIAGDVLLAEAWAMLEDQLDALQLADALADRLQEPDVASRTRELAYLRLIAVYSATGSWEQGSRKLRLAEGDSGTVLHSSAVQMALGLVRGRYGTPEDALAVLTPAFDQLRVGDPQRVLPLAATAIAYCHAMSDNIKAAIPLLVHAEPTAGDPWLVRRVASQLQLLSVGLREAKPDAARQLQAMGRSDRERGASLFALSAFTSAVRLGSTGSLTELSEVAARVQGPYAHLCETFAKGVSHRDAEVLLQAMDLAAAGGDQNFGRDAARSALHAARALGDKSTVREVQHRARRVLADLDAGGPTSQLDCLTPREAEIAQLAVSGLMNREIAEAMCVSVRTIEGHLYQIYSKLHVSSRSQLAELFPAPLG
ncbi:LuxR C-terminal-related transcriptional regulator [Arthrobacter antioxidans]|uniref:LuxR C-terminal-related transcriptional regulator n=1 Tax=Arthrobacter antioxidans TaxID=2895818 RepID=UPI0020003088|nr:LuxR C-terminal-related transcriptional regulator [Arthrobacter antioxidans]